MGFADATQPRPGVASARSHLLRGRKPAADGRVAPGPKLISPRALGREPRNLIDIVPTVEQLDEMGAVGRLRVLGTPVVMLENVLESIPPGTR
jgi:hypothetical protein